MVDATEAWSSRRNGTAAASDSCLCIAGASVCWSCVGVELTSRTDDMSDINNWQDDRFIRDA